MTANPHFPSVRKIAAQIRRKEVSPVEVARAHLDRIERLNPKLNAFVDYKPDAVPAQARDGGKDASAHEYKRAWAVAWCASFY